MTKQEFIELVGEKPEDVLGPDWENIISEWDEEAAHEQLCGGGCGVCSK